mmetsp:Transcript_36197/g.57913  ORF Transcript_36197/g.57913 Transcript_36197/m.57913 type:complete len:250 (+) Transcript_36197:190-939(+)
MLCLSFSIVRFISCACWVKTRAWCLFSSANSTSSILALRDLPSSASLRSRSSKIRSRFAISSFCSSRFALCSSITRRPRLWASFASRSCCSSLRRRLLLASISCARERRSRSREFRDDSIDSCSASMFASFCSRVSCQERLSFSHSARSSRSACRASIASVRIISASVLSVSCRASKRACSSCSLTRSSSACCLIRCWFCSNAIYKDWNLRDSSFALSNCSLAFFSISFTNFSLHSSCLVRAFSLSICL